MEKQARLNEKEVRAKSGEKAMRNVNSSSSKNNPTQSPLSQLTNNLIPFSTLSNICNFPLKPNPKNAPLSGKENRSQTALSHFSTSTTTPSPRVAPPPTPPLGEGGSGEQSYNLRRSDVKYKEAIYGLSDSFLGEKNSQKEIKMASSFPITIDSILDKNLETVVPSSHIRPSLPAKYKDKGKEIDASPLRPAMLKTQKDKGKEIYVTPIRPNPLMTMNKGIVFVSPSDGTRSKVKEISSPFDTRKVKGIEIGNPSVTSDSCHLTSERDKRKARTMSSRHLIIKKGFMGKVKETAVPSSGLPSETKNEDPLLAPLTLCSKKADRKGKSNDMPSDCQLPLKPSENLVKETEIFTCPPLPRTRSSRKRTTKDRDSELPKSWTDPHPKKPKSRRVRKEADKLDFLPPDFVEKYKAYFKEVDEFELPEEEIAGDDLDKD